MLFPKHNRCSHTQNGQKKSTHRADKRPDKRKKEMKKHCEFPIGRFEGNERCHPRGSAQSVLENRTPTNDRTLDDSPMIRSLNRSTARPAQRHLNINGQQLNANNERTAMLMTDIDDMAMLLFSLEN